MSKAYRDAIEAHNEAQRAFALVRDEYRAGRCSDAEFLAARAKMAAADAAFDVAFAAEAAQ